MFVRSGQRLAAWALACDEQPRLFDDLLRIDEIDDRVAIAVNHQSRNERRPCPCTPCSASSSVAFRRAREP